MPRLRSTAPRQTRGRAHPASGARRRREEGSLWISPRRRARGRNHRRAYGRLRGSHPASGSLLTLRRPLLTARRRDLIWAELKKNGLLPMPGLNYKDRAEDASKWLNELGGIVRVGLAIASAAVVGFLQGGLGSSISTTRRTSSRSGRRGRLGAALRAEPGTFHCGCRAFRRPSHHRKTAVAPMSRAGATPITKIQPKDPLPEPVAGTGDESTVFGLRISSEVRRVRLRITNSDG